MISHTYAYKYPLGKGTLYYAHVYKVLKRLGYINKVVYVKGHDNKAWFHALRNEELIDVTMSKTPTFIERNESTLNIFNHCTAEQAKRAFNIQHSRNIILKPTGPTYKHFTLDALGYASRSSITYKEPNYKNVDSKKFYATQVVDIVSNKRNKWGTPETMFDFRQDEPFPEIPNDHVLIIQQNPKDEVVTKFSFGDHITKLKNIIYTILNYTKEDVVVKAHPHYPLPDEVVEELSNIDRVTWVSQKCSVHDILPTTKVAIIENSTTGLECLMHDVPIISYGYPEYHWVTYDLRHALDVPHAIENIEHWWDKEKARKWLTWYVTEYLCHDYESTERRILQLLDELKNIS